ncbi:MAG: chloramphenicol O-acetyltransferase, partial [Candidatus Endobugula sp.]
MRTDLYSFKMVNEKFSKNFEDFFWKYESDVEKYTLSLMSKI